MLYKDKHEECNGLLKELSDLTSTDWSLKQEEKRVSEHVSDIGAVQDQVITALHEKLDQILLSSQAGFKQRYEDQKRENERLLDLN